MGDVTKRTWQTPGTRRMLQGESLSVRKVGYSRMS